MRKYIFIIRILIFILVLSSLPTNVYAEEMEITWTPIYPIISARTTSGFKNGFASYTDACDSIVFDENGNVLNCIDPNCRLRGDNVNGRFRIFNVITNKYGFCDTTGKVIIPTIYEDVGIDDFSDGFVKVVENGWINIIDINGKKYLPERTYKEGEHSIQYVDGFVIFSSYYYDESSKDKIYSIQNGTLKFIAEYPRTFNTHQDGILCVSDGNYYGAIDTTGKVIIPIKYLSPIRYSEGLAVLIDQSYRCTYVDINGKQPFNGSWVSANDFKDGFALVFDDNYNFGVIDKTGKQTLPYQKANFYPVHFNEGMVIFQDTDTAKYGVINAHIGKVVVEPKYDLIEPYSEGFATIRTKTEKMHISHLGDTSNTFARYIENCGVIDVNGNVIIPDDGTYNVIMPCKDGVIGVGKFYLKELIHGSQADAYNYEDYYGFIDTKGNLVWDLEFNYITNFDNNVAFTYKDGMCGILRKIPK